MAQPRAIRIVKSLLRYARLRQPARHADIYLSAFPRHGGRRPSQPDCLSIDRRITRAGHASRQLAIDENGRAIFGQRIVHHDEAYQSLFRRLRFHSLQGGPADGNCT